MGTSLTTLVMAISMMAATASAPQNVRQNVESIVAKTKALYEATSSGEVEFAQIDQGGNTTGTLWFSGGDKYRLEYPQQTIVSNGSVVWRYVPSRNQVVKSKATRRDGQITPGQILTMFPGEYATSMKGSETVNGRDVWVVRCLPGSGAKIGDVTEALLYIDKSTNRFQQIRISSPSAGIMTIRVTSARYNVSIPASTFTFTPDGDTRIVDLTR